MDTITLIVLVIIGYFVIKYIIGYLNPSGAVKYDIKKVYKRYYRSNEGKGYDEIVVHTVALAETLKGFCRFRNEPYIEEDINIEILPFVLMDREVSLDVFSEYLLYRDGTHSSDIGKIKFHINKVANEACNKNHKFVQRLREARTSQFKWFNLLDSKIKAML